jgi:cell division protein FtsI/penicillin-binding protein 2
VSAYSALLNGGTLYEPYIISSVEYRNGTRIDRSPEAKREKLFSPATLSAVREYMKAVFETRKSAGLPEAVRGTGAAYAIKGFEWGGKTGTADKLVKGQKITASCPKSSKERVCNPNRASFIGFLPYEKPEYVILVMFDESEKAAREKGIHPSGAGACGTILKRMAEEIINIEGYTYINSGTDAEVKK